MVSRVSAFCFVVILAGALRGEGGAGLTTDRAGAAELERKSYVAHVAAADALLRLNEPAAARRWLEGAPEPHRGWEWKYLSARTDQSVRELRASDKSVFALAISPDGKLLATGSTDGLIKLWDADTWAELRTLKGHEKAVYSVQFSPDGRRLVSTSGDKTSRLWDVGGISHASLTPAIAHSGVTESLSPKGEMGNDSRGPAAVAAPESIAASNDGKRELCVFRGHQSPATAAVFTPDGSWIASASYEMTSTGPEAKVLGHVYLWEPTADGAAKLLYKLTGGPKPLSSLAITADGSRIAAGCWDGLVVLWKNEPDAQPVELRIADEGLYNAVDSVAFSPDGALVVAGSKDRTALVWKTDTGELAATLRGHGGFVNRAVFSRDGRRLATASADDMVRIWNAENWELVTTLRGHSAEARSLAWTPDDARLLSGSADGTVRVWDMTYSSYDGVRMTHTDACYAALFSPDGTRLYTNGYDGTIAIWDARSGARLAHWRAHEEGKSCSTLSLSADGKRLLSCSFDRTVKIWDTTAVEAAANGGSVGGAAGRPAPGLLATLNHGEGIYHAALSPDGQFAASEQGKTVWLWKTDPPQHVATLEGHEAKVSAVAFSRDSRSIASTSRDKSVRVWSVATGSQIAIMRGHEGSIEGVAFAPSDATVMTASGDGSARSWDARTGELIRVLYQGDEALHKLSISPDGSRVAVASEGVLLIDAVHGGEVLRLRPHGDTAWHVSFSADGERLASCSWDKSIVISETRPMREKHPNPPEADASIQPVPQGSARQSEERAAGSMSRGGG